jgi:hypothetical protein
MSAEVDISGAKWVERAQRIFGEYVLEPVSSATTMDLINEAGKAGMQVLLDELDLQMRKTDGQWAEAKVKARSNLNI